MAYNNPATSGIDMSPELLVQMFTEIDNLTMVKESTGDLDRMLRIKELTGDTLPFYNGSNPLILDALTAGASGWCTAAPNLRPQPCLDLYAATQAGDYDAAKAIYDDLAPLLRFIVAARPARHRQGRPQSPRHQRRRSAPTPATAGRGRHSTKCALCSSISSMRPSR